MKIIGHGEDQELVVQMNRWEFANLAGFSSKYDMTTDYAGRDPFYVGRKAEIGELWTRLVAIRRVRGEMERVRGILKSAFDTLAPIAPFIDDVFNKAIDPNQSLPPAITIAEEATQP